MKREILERGWEGRSQSDAPIDKPEAERAQSGKELHISPIYIGITGKWE